MIHRLSLHALFCRVHNLKSVIVVEVAVCAKLVFSLGEFDAYFTVTCHILHNCFRVEKSDEIDRGVALSRPDSPSDVLSAI